MKKIDLRKSALLGGALLIVMGMAFTVMVTPAQAALPAQESCEIKWGGIWTGSTPNEIGAKCVDVQQGSVPINIDNICGTGWYLDFTYSGGNIWAFDISVDCHEFPTVFAAAAPINYGMERKGLCKLVSIDDAYFGGYVTAVVKGKPVNLKLKADGKTYVLPVVPGSVVANGDGTYTAQFYTIDPATGQALVPAGEYGVRCHGASGSNDGSGNTVVISY